jgi:hypothetical protein
MFGHENTLDTLRMNNGTKLYSGLGPKMLLSVGILPNTFIMLLP